jgi:adenine-specific DNA methylase
MNLPDFREQVVSKTKEAFLNLIPEDVLNTEVDKIVKDFWANDFEKIAKEELRKLVAENLKNELVNAPNLYYHWNSEKNRQEMTPYLEQVLVAAAPQMFAEIMRSVAQLTLSNMRNNIY